MFLAWQLLLGVVAYSFLKTFSVDPLKKGTAKMVFRNSVKIWIKKRIMFAFDLASVTFLFFIFLNYMIF